LKSPGAEASIALTNYYILPELGGNRASVPEVPCIDAVLCRKKLTHKHTLKDAAAQDDVTCARAGVTAAGLSLERKR
jgi:hypothetical protein